MIRVSCPRDDAHQTMPVREILKTAFQKGADGKYHVNPQLPKTIRKIAKKPTNLFWLSVILTILIAAPLPWKMLDADSWAKMPLSAVAEYIGSFGHWAVIAGGVAIAFLLRWLWHPGYLETLRARNEGIYCYADDEIFFEK